MADSKTDRSRQQEPLRLWPGVAIVVLQWLAGFVLPVLVPEAGPAGAMVALLGGPALLVWWAFFSRALGAERWSAVLLMIVALVATRPLLHESIRAGGMGILFFLYAIPLASLGLVAWAVVSHRLSLRVRRTAMVVAILVPCAAWAFVRTTGVTGGGDWDFKWRWARTHEDRLLARAGNDSAALPSTSPAAAPAEAESAWPGFRGPGRDSIIRGVRLETDWSASPPAELWRRPIGPGWSSFAVWGELVYTQEQRGEKELVACYRASTGEPVWTHQDTARFWEPQAGAGPRATPTLSEGRVFTFGATGIVNALDARDGSLIWSRNASSDTKAEVPGWGFASSPLVVDDIVIVYAGALAAYDVATGDPRWVGPAGGGSYSSPHLATLEETPQILMLSGKGLAGVAPTDGSALWQYPWPSGIVQPALTADGDVLISGSGMSGGTGMRRLAIAHESGGWSTEERWTSNRLKPNFNDFVVHEGHAFGFDGSILASIDLETGERSWKGGRYGNGQLVLLPDQDLLLVLSEKGELALVGATPDEFTELARFPAIEGKTWNHPVLVGDLLLVRNAREMAAFRLSLAGV